MKVESAKVHNDMQAIILTFVSYEQTHVKVESAKVHNSMHATVLTFLCQGFHRQMLSVGVWNFAILAKYFIPDIS